MQRPWQDGVGLCLLQYGPELPQGGRVLAGEGLHGEVAREGEAGRRAATGVKHLEGAKLTFRIKNIWLLHQDGADLVARKRTDQVSRRQRLPSHRRRIHAVVRSEERRVGKEWRSR